MANLNSFLVAHNLHLELDQALARQAAVGGDLVTCLLEVSTISEGRMLTLLSEVYGRSAAPAGELPPAELAARRLVPRATAQRHVMYPFELRNDLLAAYVQEPLPTAVEEDLVFALGVQINQRIALAARVHQALAKAYGLPLTPRMKELLTQLDSPVAEAEATAVGIERSQSAASAPVAHAPNEGNRRSGAGGLASSRPDAAWTRRADSHRTTGDVRPALQPWRGGATLVGLAPAHRMTEGDSLGGAPLQNAQTEQRARACPSTLPPPPSATEPLRSPSDPAQDGWVEAERVPALGSPTSLDDSLPQAADGVSGSAPPGATPAEFLMEATSATAADIEERRQRRASLPGGTSVLRDWALRALGLSEPAGLSERRRGPMTLGQAEKALAAARMPDEALRLYFDFSRQYFEYTAMFRLQGDLAEGQDAWGPGATRDRVRGIGVTLDLPSILSQARDTRAPFVGVASWDGIDAVLAEDLGRPMRREVACVPVLVRGRALVVLYGDLGSEPVVPDEIGDVISLASLLGEALERMLLRRKRELARAKREHGALDLSSAPPAATSFGPTPGLDVALPSSPTLGAKEADTVPPPASTRAAHSTAGSPPSAAPGTAARGSAGVRASAAPIDAATGVATARAGSAAGARPSAIATVRPAAPRLGDAHSSLLTATTTPAPITTSPPMVSLGPPHPPRLPRFDFADSPHPTSTTPPTPSRPADARSQEATPLAPQAAFTLAREDSPTPIAPDVLLDREQPPAAVLAPAPLAAFDLERGNASQPPLAARRSPEAERGKPAAAARSESDPAVAASADAAPVVAPLAHLAALSATWTLDPAAVLGSSPAPAPAAAAATAEARQGPAPRPYARPVADSVRVEPSYPRLTFADPSDADRTTSPAPVEPATPAKPEADLSDLDPMLDVPADLGASAAAMAAGLRPVRIPHIAREEPESGSHRRQAAPAPAAIAIGRIAQTPDTSSGSMAVGARQPPASMGATFASLPPVLIHADLVETVIGGGARGEQALGEILEIGEAAIPSVFSRFPGPLSVDRQYAATELPRPDECGPVLRILSALRRLALPFLAVRSADSSAEVRFWATYLLGDLHYQDAAIALWPRLFDEDLSVRTVALHAARTFVASKEAGAPIRVGLERIVASPDESIERRLHAIATIGALEWTPFVPALLRILDRSRSAVSVAAAEALSALTGEDFGADPKIWNKWWKNHSRLFGVDD